MTLDEILYNAITADTALMQAIGGRVKDVCFEVGPDEQDNTPLPCIIVTDGGLQSQQLTKDTDWLTPEDQVQAGIEVSAESPNEVRSLIRQCRIAVARYVHTLSYEDTPQLDMVQTDGVAWDWMKPCYFDTLRYQCSIYNDLAEEDNE